MKQSIRHQKIVELVKQKGYLSTDELKTLFFSRKKSYRKTGSSAHPTRCFAVH